MAKYKYSNRNQMEMKMIDFNCQLVEGTLEHAIDYLLEERVDLSFFDKHFCNDKIGAPAYPPKIMLKIILFAYANGIIGSRKIEKVCAENVIFMTLANGHVPHFTYIADFIHRFEDEIKMVFKEVLLTCWELDLIGGEFLALDGCKLPSNAAKEWSGTFDNLRKKEEKIRKTLNYLIEKHSHTDKSKNDKNKINKQLDKIAAKADKVKRFLENNDPKRGPRGKEIQSNITDNESAKMKTSNGFIQGYNGLAMADAKNQIIINAEAYGSNNESKFLPEFIESSKENLLEKEIPVSVLTKSTVIADTGFFSEDNLKYMADSKIDCLDQRQLDCPLSDN